jgi:hypothetical protein
VRVLALEGLLHQQPAFDICDLCLDDAGRLADAGIIAGVDQLLLGRNAARIVASSASALATFLASLQSFCPACCSAFNFSIVAAGSSSVTPTLKRYLVSPLSLPHLASPLLLATYRVAIAVVHVAESGPDT